MTKKKIEKLTPEMLPTYEKVIELLMYDPESGAWFRKIRHDVRKEWNTRYANKAAGSIRTDGYLTIAINRKNYYAHRLAWIYMTGEWPMQQIDHIDLNKSNCKWSNLRSATNSQNHANIDIRTDNTSGFKGVYFQRRTRKWCADIIVRSKKLHLGSYTDPKDAGQAYMKAAKRYFGEFARS